ncbi:MAG: hypothetical protein ABIN95_12150 [Mucilaginibacter sp.]
MKIKLFVIIVGLLYSACNSPVKTDKKPDTSAIKTSATTAAAKPKSPKRHRVTLEINTMLTHKRSAFRCDSVIIVNYNGLVNGHTYYPVNDKGEWLNTITKKKKLNVLQLKTLNSIIGNPASFKVPLKTDCIKPDIGVVYFKDGRVIAQSEMSLECAWVKSTAQLGSNDHSHLFNKKALRRLDKFYSGLKM